MSTHTLKKTIHKSILLIFLALQVFGNIEKSSAQCAGADVVASYTGNCLPALVKFTVNPAFPTGTVYYWDLGDGNGQILGGDTFFHQYTKGGSYGISVEVVQPNGNKCTITKPAGFLTFDAATSLGFYADQTILCTIPAVLSLHDTSGNILGRDWYIDGSLYPDHSKDIIDTLKSSGYRTVTLVVYNKSNCTEVVDRKNYVYVAENIPVNFCSSLKENATHDQITAKFKLGFDTTGFNVSEITWSFPGGSPSSYTGTNPPSVLYTDLSQGYDVTLVVKTNIGCSAKFTKTQLIQKYYSVSQTNICSKSTASLQFLKGTAIDRRVDFSFIYSNLPLTSNNSGTSYTIKFNGIGKADMYFGLTYFNSSCRDTLFVPALFDVLPPIADFTSQDNNQCSPPNTVHFRASNANTTSGTNNYTWLLYDNNLNQLSGSPIGPTTLADTSFVFGNGAYSVRLIVSNTNGCADTILKKNFVRIGVPDANVTTSPDTICVGQAVLGKNFSTMPDDQSNPISYVWTFVNQQNANINYETHARDANVIIKYPGVYDLNYSIYSGPINTAKCKSFKLYTNVLHVNGVAAAINVTGSDGCSPLTKKLTADILSNYPKNSPLTYSWAVQPAADAVIANPTGSSTDVLFKRQGCYGVTLIVTGDKGCQAIVQKDSFICFGTKAAFSINPNGCRNVPLVLKNKSLLSPDHFKWTVSPSSGVTIDNDTARNPKISIANSGCYTVLLSTSHDTLPNCLDTVSHQVCIFTPPVLHSIYSPDSASHCAPRFDLFVASATNADSFFWDFGDGNSIRTADSMPKHAYFKNNNSGYSIKAAAIDSNGCTSDTLQLKNYIKISGPEPAFIIASKPPCDGGVINFINKSKFVYNYFFLYGDNSGVDSNEIKSHFYKYVDYTRDSNVYNPTLFAHDETGCAATATAVVKLYRPPFVYIATNDTNGCAPYTVHFIDTTKYANTFIWNFGDGNNDTAFQPVHTYTDASPVGSPYKVTLTAVTDKGCNLTSPPLYITVHPTPKVHMNIIAPKIICYRDSVHFKGFTTVPVQKFLWKFGDSTLTTDTSSLQNPVYHYTYPGKHKVSFMGVTAFGCKDSIVDSTSIFTHDSIADPAPAIYYVTVTKNNLVEIVFEKKSNPDFSFNSIYQYPLSANNVIYSSSDTTDTTVFDFSPNLNVNKQSYGYSIQSTDLCGYTSAFGRAHFTVFLSVNKSGNRRLQLTWNKYTGWDSVRAYEIYRMDNKKNFTLLTTVSGFDSIYTDTSLCPNTYTYYVSAVYQNHKFVSNSNISSNSPDYIFPVTPVVLRKATVVNNQQVSVNWDAASKTNFKFYSVDRNANDEGWQSNYYITTDLSFIDNNVDVSRYSYKYRVKVVDECGSTGPLSNIGASILLNGVVINDSRSLSWNNYILWDKGVSAYYIQLQQKDGSFKDIAVNQPTDTIFLDELAHDDLGVPTCYRVYAIENTDFPTDRDTSISNIACPNLAARLYFPNAFSPNNDSTNEVFKPQGLSVLNNSDSKDLQYDFRIYNRWGQQIFETHDLNAGWDGSFQGKPVPVDVYVYIVEAHGLDAKRFFIRGQVTLIR